MPEVVNTSALSFDTDISNESSNAQIEDDRPTAIKVENVSMIFNMASERLNNLKEYFLKLVKHQLFFEELVALDDISFEVKKGDVFGILGTNGSGKSTLLKIIAGVLEPSKGSVEINGAIAPLIELGAGFDMDLSARENIYLNGALLGYSKDFIEDHFDDIVEFAEVEKFLDMPMKNYSSGMVARIAFAIATVMVPEILIVDEVLSVGDFMFQQKCENRINDLIEKHGVTVLIVSHSNDQIERLCNKAIWIEKGHTRIMGDAAKVCSVYSVLGGRTGNAESEQIVFETLLHSKNTIEPATKPIIYTGKDHLELASNAILTDWKNTPCESVFLVPDHTHVFGLAISGTAGAMGAPILPTSNNTTVPLIIKNTLRALRPSTIFIAADEDIANGLANDAGLNELASNIVPIKCGPGCRGIRLATLQFGIENNIWNSRTAILAYHDDVIPSFAISPYSYINKTPFIITDPKRVVIEDDVLALLKQAGIDEFISVGAISQSPIVDDLRSKNYSVTPLSSSSEFESLYTIFNWVTDNVDIKTRTCIIASKDQAKWPTLISSPSISGKNKCGILFEDTTNLDSVASCINITKRIEEKIFLGYKDILGINIKLLNKHRS